jgi:hypothetical protein
MKLHFRIRPAESLLDLDPPLIRQAMGAPPGVADLRIFDDRASDATFVTLVVSLAESGPEALAGLRSALLAIPRVTASVVDRAGNEIPVSNMPATELLHFVRES